MAQAAEKERTQTSVALQEDDVAGKPKLLAALDKRGVTPETWRVLMETVWPGAQSPNSVMMAIDYCRARNLDPLKRPVHIVPMWSKRHGKMVETIWPGISEVRTTAHRTGQYVGCSAPIWGPMVNREFVARDKNGNETECKSVEFPQWCRMTVKRRHPSGLVEEYTAEVWWEETYATESRFSEIPNEMWQRRSRGQLAKCAEAAALRMAFPEELGSDYTAEEMAGRVLDDAHMKSQESLVDAPPAPTRADFSRQPAHPAEEAQIVEDDGEPEFHAGGTQTTEPEEAPEAPTETHTEEAISDAEQTTRACVKAPGHFKTAEQVTAWFDGDFQATAKESHLSKDQIARVKSAVDARLAALTK